MWQVRVKYTLAMSCVKAERAKRGSWSSAAADRAAILVLRDMLALLAARLLSFVVRPDCTSADS